MMGLLLGLLLLVIVVWGLDETSWDATLKHGERRSFEPRIRLIGIRDLFCGLLGVWTRGLGR